MQECRGAIEAARYATEPEPQREQHLLKKVGFQDVKRSVNCRVDEQRISTHVADGGAERGRSPRGNLKKESTRKRFCKSIRSPRIRWGRHLPLNLQRVWDKVTRCRAFPPQLGTWWQER